MNSRNPHSEATTEGDGFITSTGTGNDGLNYTGSLTYNLARTPLVVATGSTWQASAPKLEGWANRQTAKTVTRYGASATFQSDYDRPLTGVAISGRAHFSIIL